MLSFIVTIYNITLIIGCCLWIQSCEIDPERKKKERIQLIEHLTKQQTDSISMELDSLCKLKQTELLEPLVDSLLQKRIEEIRKGLDEIKQGQ